MANEVKSIDVHPNAEQSTINLYQAFGWVFHSTQEVKENYQERRGDSIYQVRETKIKLTFQRNRNMPNYERLVGLENMYYSIQDYYSPTRFGFIWGILAAIGLFCWLVPGIIIIIWRVKRYNKLYPVWLEQAQKAKTERDGILNMARSLC